MNKNGMNVTEKLIKSHLVEGSMEPGEEIGLLIDQSLTQDATGTMVMLELEAMGLDRVKTELSAQYVDHQLIQTDFRNADDHLFLYSACQRFGVWYSRPGTGVSHPVHMSNFGIPGKTLIGSDSHTPAAGSLGMLAIGAGGLEVAMAMAGEPLYIRMPEVWGVELTGELPDWVSAKDVILEMLRRHDVKGGVGQVIEYHGPGVKTLSAMDRHVIANMGTELGATSTVFPADGNVRTFMEKRGRGSDFLELSADAGSEYDVEEWIDLSEVEPLVALPSSPGKVVTVESITGQEIYQSYIGSSANAGLRDFAVPAMMVQGRTVHPRVSLDINPATREVLENLTAMGLIQHLMHAGARIHEAGCNGCIGMGQAPATGKISLRTVPRNFPGRSGTIGDLVHLVSPETAAASALTGVVTDPRTLNFPYPQYVEPVKLVLNRAMLVAPPVFPDPLAVGGPVLQLEKGPNIKSLPPFLPLPETLKGEVLLKVGDNISTDGIMPAGSKILPFRSNVPEISKFVFSQVDPTFYDRAMALTEKRKENGPKAGTGIGKAKERVTKNGNEKGTGKGGGQGFVIVGGENYGQGSSREHAALAPRYLGLRLVVVKSFARIHWQNLVNFGILPLTFSDKDDWDRIDQGDVLEVAGVWRAITEGSEVEVRNVSKDEIYSTEHVLSPRQIQAVLEGSLLTLFKNRMHG